ncbi:MAG TPA: NADH-quinone oxidoreductase subunit J, partial [Sediminibacterium sp.]
MSTTEILFFFLSALAVFSAIMVLVSKSPVHSVLWLIVVFFAISGHYVLLNAQFLAIVNLIVYAGAIMVLFLFVIMLMNLNAETEPQKHIWMKLAGVISGGCFLMVLVSLIRQASDMQA